MAPQLQLQGKAETQHTLCQASTVLAEHSCLHPRKELPTRSGQTSNNKKRFQYRNVLGKVFADSSTGG